MSQISRRLMVRRVLGSGKFIIIAINPEFPNLSRNDGLMTEPELATFLSENYDCHASEIASLIDDANVSPELGT